MNLTHSCLLRSSNTLVHAELLRCEREGVVVEVRRHGPGSLVSKLGSKFGEENVLKWTKDFQAAYMGILAVHIVCNNDNLQDICVHWPTVDDFVSTTRS